MHFSFADIREHEQESALLEERMKRARTVPGTQKLHSFVPLSTEAVEVRRFSASPICRHERVLHKDAHSPQPATSRYVTVAYDDFCWLACVLSINSLQGSVIVKLLHPHIPSNLFVYPDQEDIVDVDPSDILTQVAPTTATGRTYKLSRKEIQDATTAIAAKSQ